MSESTSRSYAILRAARREKSEAWEHADYLVDKAKERSSAANDELTRAESRVREAEAALDAARLSRNQALVDYSSARRACEKHREDLDAMQNP